MLGDGDATKHDAIMDMPVYLAYQFADTKIAQSKEEAAAYEK